MSSNTDSDQHEASSPDSIEQQPQPQPLSALPPFSFGHFSPGPLFGPPPHPTAPTNTTELPPTPPRTPPTSETTLRPLDSFFAPHLNNDHKRRRAVHEYMLCRMTQDLTALYTQRALLALALLMPLPPPPPPSAPLSASGPETIFTALLVAELLTLLERQTSLRAAALRIVRTMWSLGLPGRTVARADAFVRGTPPGPAASSAGARPRLPYRRPLAERFRAVYGASYRDYSRNCYYPQVFQRDSVYAGWSYYLGLDEFEIGP